MPDSTPVPPRDTPLDALASAQPGDMTAAQRAAWDRVTAAAAAVKVAPWPTGMLIAGTNPRRGLEKRTIYGFVSYIEANRPCVVERRSFATAKITWAVLYDAVPIDCGATTGALLSFIAWCWYKHDRPAEIGITINQDGTTVSVRTGERERIYAAKTTFNALCTAAEDVLRRMEAGLGT